MHDGLKRILERNGLSMHYLEMDVIAFYYPKAKTVFINKELEDSDNANFELAHELGHFLAGHDKFENLYSINVFRSKMEHEANVIAISMLLSIYIEELSDIEQFNLDRFMRYYKIKSSLESVCEAQCRIYFEENIACFG